MARVRVLVADDHPLFREGVERAVRARPDLELVAAAGDGREALDAIRAMAPDVALLDLRLPGLDGLKVLHALIRDGLSTRVVFLSAAGDPATVEAALAAGAAGYFAKETEREVILDGVAAAARGAAPRRPRQTTEPPPLTARERDILRLIADGLSAPQIAARLIVAVPTVKSHQARLYGKLGVSDRAAAVAQGMRRGLLE
jgi:two-component system nitrate/nitrite response regulator NarL